MHTDARRLLFVRRDRVEHVERLIQIIIGVAEKRTRFFKHL